MRNNFLNLLIRRRSTRKFTDKPLDPSLVETILRSALLAPSSKNAKPIHLIAIEDKQQLRQLSLCKKSGSKCIADCALAIIVAGDPFVSDVWIEDASIVSITMQLQAEDLGIGSCWIQIRERYTANEMTSEQFVKDIIDAPLHLQILSIIIFGHKDQVSTDINEDNLKWENVHIGKY